MATVSANFAINIDQISLNASLADLTSIAFLNNDDYVSPIGNTYHDALQIGYASGGVSGYAFFGGPEIIIGLGPSVTGGTVTGYFQTIDPGGGLVSDFGIEGFSYSAVAIYNAADTSDTADDNAIIAAILAGDDTFDLSPYADVASGFGGNDLMEGNGGNDRLLGGAGNDTLDGGLGVDTLIGGAGLDTYVVTAGDSIVEQLTGGVDTVRSAGTWTLGANLEKLVLTGTALNGTGNGGANTLTGNAVGNTLNGLVGSDILSGFGGNDVLKGGAGNDTLTGGAGNDSFVFDTPFSAATNVDKVADFQAGADKLRLDDDVFTALTGGVALTAAQFVSGFGLNAAQTLDQLIIYNTNTGVLYYDADGSGAGATAIKFAVLGTLAHPIISAADFLIVA